MNHIACHYAIVRFLPFVETGEFANVGIVLFAPQSGFFGFKLLGNRCARVTNFFEQLDAKVCRAAIQTFRKELERIEDMLKNRTQQSFETPGPKPSDGAMERSH